MGISLAPTTTPDEEEVPLGQPPKPKPVVPSAGMAPPTPPAGGTPGLALAPMTAPASIGSIPAPTVAAPTAPVDRVKLATDTFANISASRKPEFDADVRDEIRNSAALGQVASGGLRTRVGNLKLARGRDLDALQKDLSLKAAEGSVADASTAYQQALAGSQQGLAQTIGLGSLDQNQQQIDLAKKTAEIEAQFKAGSLTLAQKDQALRDLANTQNYNLATERQRIEAAFQAKQIGLAERNAALQELAQSQQNTIQTGQLTLAQKEQAANQANEAARIQLAKDQLEQTGEQFGLSLAQQKELAELADATQNRQLDISTAQGQNSLLLELARIMGGPSGNLDPNFIQAIARSLGFTMPGTGINDQDGDGNPDGEVDTETGGGGTGSNG